MNKFGLKRSKGDGFSLIEVLVAIVVLAIGVLGVAALQTKSLSQGQGTMQATQAWALAYDLADRMRANPDGAYQGAYVLDPTNLSVLQSAPSSCASAGQCTQQQLGLYDLNTWYQLLQKTLSLGGTARIYCSDGSSCGTTGTLGPPQTINIVVYWVQDRSTIVPGSFSIDPSKNLNCGYTLTTGTYTPSNGDLPCVTLSVQP